MVHMYGLSESAQQHVSKAARIAKDIVLPNAGDVDVNGRFPTESMDALAEAGFYGLCLPQNFGGRGEGMRAFAGVVEELASACGSTAMVYVMHVSAAQAIRTSSTLAERDAMLSAIASGKHLTTLAFSETGSRSQFWAPVSKLEENNGDYVTSASKSWVTAAGHADSYVSTAQKPGAVSPLESTVYLVHTKTKGVQITSAFNGLGLRGNDSAPVSLERITVPRSDLISAPGEGPKVILEVVLPWFAIGTAAMANGLCQAAVQRTAAHLVGTEFTHDGSKLRDLPMLRARLAQMSVRTAQSRSLLGYTLNHLEQPDAATPLSVLQSRRAAMEAAVEVTDLAMKACGGAAFSRHLGIERLFRDARAGWVMAPTVDHLDDFIGKALTGLPLF
ncbi:MAG TPA: acyl-CoA dehydrogenase family protein [Pyrinomonadaceae bacterium]|nr:acyl-CoA dehydrogenase family protein [Pyrinomonadaceae bacterium]